MDNFSLRKARRQEFYINAARSLKNVDNSVKVEYSLPTANVNVYVGIFVCSFLEPHTSLGSP